MTAPQSAQYTAYNAFLLLVDSNEATTQKVPVFFKHTQTLRLNMARAKAEDTESQKDTKGLTKDKNQIKSDLLGRMTDLTAMVSGFASEKNNNVLANRVNNFPTVFARTRQNDVATVCRGILDATKPFLPDLVDYTITTETLQDIWINQ